MDSESLSDLDGPLGRICDELQVRPKSVHHARNHLRREIAGVQVLRDLRIPSPTGGDILADAYLPLSPGKRFPVLISCTLYGRRVPWGGPDLESEQDILSFERAEDQWYSTSAGTEVVMPDLGPWSPFFTQQRGFENLGTLNTLSYVPSGYAMVRIDPKGVSQTPGKRWVPGELPRDFAAAVEWAAQQSWSNGKVALVGSSGGANTQWAVAALKPKGLKCFVPYASELYFYVLPGWYMVESLKLTGTSFTADIDAYREAAYIGGVPSTRYMENWFARVRGVSPKWGDLMDAGALTKASPTFTKFWEMQASDPTQSVDIPCFLAASQIFMIHGRGAYEAYMVRRPENTHLQLVDSNYYSWPSRESAAKILQFLDFYLKGEERLAPERVGIQVRLGNQNWYWRKERSWPVPGTTYTHWHLTPDMALVITPPTDVSEARIAYPAKPPLKGRSGLSFHSPSVPEDMELAGHFTAVLNVSSTAPDADVVVLIWAIDETGQAVSYGATSSDPEPLAKGFLRVSHRATDPKLSLPWRPWHTHKEEDLAPLQGAQDVVEIAVEMMPAAARVRKGWKLRVDICPSEAQPDIPGYRAPTMRVWYGEDQDDSVENALHVGGNRLNYILCPMVPKREEYPKCIL